MYRIRSGLDRLCLRKSTWVSCAIVSAALAFGAAAQAESVSTHHVRDVVRDGLVQPVGRLAETQTLSLDIVLPVRDREALDALAEAVSNPMSFSYRHYLTPAEFTEKFGPTQEDYAAVVKFAQDHGLSVTGGSRDAMDVQVK